MYPLLRFAHLGLACVWLGCILAAIIVDLTLAPAGEVVRARLARFHWALAACVETPAFLGVFVTGAYILSSPHAAGLGFQVMVTAGVLAIFLNVFKVWLTYKRLLAMRRSSWLTLEKLSFYQSVLGYLVLIGVLTATLAGAATRMGV
jgi:hypothetical protein